MKKKYIVDKFYPFEIRERIAGISLIHAQHKSHSYFVVYYSYKLSRSSDKTKNKKLRHKIRKHQARTKALVYEYPEEFI